MDHLFTHEEIQHDNKFIGFWMPREEMARLFIVNDESMSNCGDWLQGPVQGFAQS